jgi:hypothetical protein
LDSWAPITLLRLAVPVREIVLRELDPSSGTPALLIDSEGHHAVTNQFMAAVAQVYAVVERGRAAMQEGLQALATTHLHQSGRNDLPE